MPSLEDNERAADTMTTNLPESSTGNTTDTSGDGELGDDGGNQETTE